MIGEIRFKFEALTEAAVEAAFTDAAIHHLTKMGYAVTPPNENWETMLSFNRRLGLHYSDFHRALKQPGCPNVRIHRTAGRGPGNRRISHICSNPAFEAFILKNKK